jgi:cytochrome c553
VIGWLANIIVLTGALLLSNISYAEVNLNNGKAVYKQACATCHGEYGEVSNEVIPNILGQYPAYMLTQMAAFLADDPKESRGGVAGNLNRSILSGLTVEDIQDVVAYLGTIEYRIVGASKEEAESRGELAANGWWLANYAGCGNCHGDDFQGLRVRNPGTGELDPGVGTPMTPKLVGLKYEYLVRQLRAYQSGDRAGGLSAMKHIMAPLFQSPRMMQAIGVYAEEVSIVPVIDAESGAQQ